MQERGFERESFAEDGSRVRGPGVRVGKWAARRGRAGVIVRSRGERVIKS